MPAPHRVALRLAGDPGHQIKLTYTESPQGGRQARLVGRTVMRPDINLEDYSCRAVIDWLDVVFSTGTSSQFRHVQAFIEGMTGEKHFVEAIDPTAGGVSASFRVRFQEARLGKVAQVVEAVMTKYGEMSVPEIVGLEVSIDFKPKVASDEACYRMVGVLTRHMFPNRDYMSNRYDRPRTFWAPERGRGEMTMLLPYSMLNDKANHGLFGTELDKPGVVDGTFYVGEMERPPSWRVMHKRLDKQNPETGTRRVLELEERRTRIEVTLGPKELRAFGIGTLADLRAFTFSPLQGLYFRFLLPTFGADGGIGLAAVHKHREDSRRRKFFGTGVVGLIQMDAVRVAFRKKQRPELLKEMKKRRVPVPRRTQTGEGAQGSCIAFDELCRRAEMALRKLGARERE